MPFVCPGTLSRHCVPYLDDRGSHEVSACFYLTKLNAFKDNEEVHVLEQVDILEYRK